MRIEQVEGFMARYLGTEDNTAAREDARIKYFHLFFYLYLAVSSYRLNLSCLERLKEKFHSSLDRFFKVFMPSKVLFCVALSQPDFFYRNIPACTVFLKKKKKNRSLTCYCRNVISF